MGGDPGSVLLARQLDCETQAEYNLTIAVSNGVHSVFTQVHQFSRITLFIFITKRTGVWGLKGVGGEGGNCFSKS